MACSVSKYDSKRAEILRKVDSQDNHGPYRADLETLRKFEIPQWYKDAKFGIFIHWGVFSVPGSQNEWYPRKHVSVEDPAFKEHIQRFGAQENWLQRFRFRSSKRKSGTRGLDAPFQAGRSALRGARRRAP